MSTTISHRTNSVNELIKNKEDEFKICGEIRTDIPEDLGSTANVVLI